MLPGAKPALPGARPTIPQRRVAHVTPQTPNVAPKAPKKRITSALLTAATRPTDLDTIEKPRCLLEIEGLPIAVHMLKTLHHAGITKVTVELLP